MSPVRKTTDQSVLTDHLKRSADYMPASPDRAGRSLGSGWNQQKSDLSDPMHFVLLLSDPGTVPSLSYSHNLFSSY